MREYLDPEILPVDELVASDDFVFRRKCLGKMEDVAGALYYTLAATSRR